MARIVGVVTRNDHTIEIILDNQHRITYDMKSRLNTLRFRDLEELETFKKVHVKEGDTLVWNHFCEMSLSEILYSLAK